MRWCCKATADSDKLTASQKENLSALATLAAGIAAGVGSGSAPGAVTGAQAGRNAVENNSMAGDKGRKSLQESKEWWKEQIREKLCENTVSQITNGLVNVAGETGDLVILSGDIAFDIVAALTTCATEGSYPKCPFPRLYTGRSPVSFSAPGPARFTPPSSSC